MTFHLDYVTWRPISTVWPGAVTTNRRRAPFKAPLRSTLETFERELRELGARNVVIEIAVREEDFRLDGRLRANVTPTSPGVILSLDSRHGPMRYAVDTFTVMEDNIRALALSLEALRRVDRYGLTQRGEQYAGWRQLDSDTSAARGRALIIVHGGIPEALRATHPDHGGDVNEFLAVQAARQEGSHGG